MIALFYLIHDDLNYNLIKKYSKIIVDTRGKYKADQITIFNA